MARCLRRVTVKRPPDTERLQSRGHSEAEASLEYLYRHKRGVPRDDIEAAHWYPEKIQGDASAQVELLHMYLLGIGMGFLTLY